MDESTKDTKLTQAEKELNAKGFEVQDEKVDFEKKEFDVAEEWDAPEEAKESSTATSVGASDVAKVFAQQKRASFMKYILIAAVVFFVGAFAFAAFTMMSGSNVSSPDNIDISIIGPTSINGGEQTTLQIVVANKNTVALENVQLFLEFPRSVQVVGDELDNQRLIKNLGTIEPSGVASETVQVIFWGEEKAKQIIIGQLEFNFASSNAELRLDMEYVVDILSAPVVLNVDMFEEANPGQEIELRVVATSELEVPIDNALLEVDYPSTFTFIDSTPEPSYSDNQWRIGTLNSFGDYEITIRGTIDGEDTQEKTFRVTIGTEDPEQEKEISVSLNSIAEQVKLTKPFIGLSFAVGQDDSNGFTAVAGGKASSIKVNWINNDTTQISDPEILVKVTGDFLPGQTRANQGFFQTTDNTAIWNQKTDDRFSAFEPGQIGVQSLSIRTKPVLSDAGVLIINPRVRLEAWAQGKRISDINVPDSTNAAIVKELRIITEADFSARAVHNIGPFTNRGPMPPKANVETTYTIVWRITNTANDLENVAVRSRLPTYASWKGVFTPKGEDITYDEVTGEVIWNIPLIPAGAGVVNAESAAEVAFQIGITPSLTQVDQSPTIIDEATFSATDSFTETLITERSRDLDIRLEADPQYLREHGKVVE